MQGTLIGVIGTVSMPHTNPPFTVDTHIFRELGELLVGRDSTALMELIKNSYDADAKQVVVTATELEQPDRARIVIQDDGSGMTSGQFCNGFLRIASRFKEEGGRRSAGYGRRYTGSKGIGRLAAHKLARIMAVASVSGAPSSQSRQAIEARIDWQKIEEHETLDELTNEIALDEFVLRGPRAVGTTITLERLRRAWSPEERTRFVAECRACQPPAILTDPLPRRLLPRPLLFPTPARRETSDEDPGFVIRLDGDFAEGDAYWTPLIDQTNWVLEIEAAVGEPEVRYAIAPTTTTQQGYPEVRRREFRHPHPTPADGPFFQARVFLRDEQIRKNKALASWARQTSGIRVYLEGFRVLPYGEPDDDWLRINADTIRRSWEVAEAFNQMFDRGTAGPDNWQQFGSSNTSYTGAVFLKQANAPTLQILVNREGFAANRAFYSLVTLMRLGVDLLTRTRAAGKSPELERRRVAARQERSVASTGAETGVDSSEAPIPRLPPSEPTESAPPNPVPTLMEATAQITAAVENARRVLAENADLEAIRRHLDLARSAAATAAAAVDRERDAGAVFRVLASVGTQMASFVHEIRGLLGTAVAVHEAVDRLRKNPEIRGVTRQRLNEVYASLGDLRQQIERQAAYLIDVTAPDARRRRSRQKIAERFDAAARLVQTAVDRRQITLVNEIPLSVRSPAMFPAEVTAIFSNLLTNAVKAAEVGGRIRAGGRDLVEGGTAVVVENTGVAVDLSDADRWFLPFESTTTNVDATLGQGMGLGLTITRDILEQYGASVRFVPPSEGYATAIEICFPE